MAPDPAPALGADDTATVAAQLGRPPRGAVAVAHRCPCGRPDVVATRPRLPGGTPFPTTFYLTCPRASSACSTLESTGVMTDLTQRLRDDPALAAAYQAAHEAYLAARHALGARTGDGEVPEIAGVSAGGMPDRVKCLHALLAHALAAGPGVNPLGDETLALVGAWWERPCGVMRGATPHTPRRVPLASARETQTGATPRAPRREPSARAGDTDGDDQEER